MPRNQVAARYARALFQTAEDSEAARVELGVLSEILQKERQIELFFVSPAISKEEKREALGELKKKLPRTSIFLESLVDANRFLELPGIYEEFSTLCEERAGQLTVHLESASPLPEATLEDIRALLQEKWKKRLNLITKINPELIGGFIARSSGKILDASARNQLENLRSQVISS